MTYEQWLAALCLWREGRGLSLPALSGMWHVILNRTSDPAKRWPRTIDGVILQHAQFSSFLQSDPNVTQFPKSPLPDAKPSPDWLAFLDCQTVVSTSLDPDATLGANHYEAEPGDKRPDWADPSKITTQIGPIRFYKL